MARIRKPQRDDPLQDRFRSIGLYSAYADDRPLLKRLGLRVFDKVAHGVALELGTAELWWDGDAEPYATVEVSVTCWPAKFWRFVVRCPARRGEAARAFALSTGSGAFREYWPTVLQFARRMITHERLPE